MTQGSTAMRRRTLIEDAYDQFLLERQDNRLSPRTLGNFGYHLGGFFRWLRREHPNVRQLNSVPPQPVESVTASSIQAADRR